MKHLTLAALSIAVAAAGASAQTYHTAPFGFATVEGRDNNTIPWWSLSATYQQVHDASDLANVFGSSFAVITSINFRKYNTGSAAPGRTMDAQITLGVTTISAAGATGTFATNIGPTPQIVLPYTTVSLPTLSNIGAPNPIGWSFPFQAPFAYATPAGNLCWELRFTNASINSNMATDAVGRLNSIVSPNVGTGCIASGQSSAASIGLKSLSMSSGAWRNRLDRGAMNAPVVQLIGIGQASIPLPGFCSGLQLFPIADLQNVTDATGQWDSTFSFGNLYDTPTVDLLAQFAWVDFGLPNGVGLSDASLIALPADSIRNLSRIYAAPFGGGLGNENATSGSGNTRYGLVTIFGQ
ncbi:MAG: hypothetical protein HZB39_08230 [Planctomycetes bacterium]|nr:hypothetical protein [Planctomycetota bacterium]